MRDVLIFGAIEKLKGNLSNDVMTMHNLNVLVKTRAEAMENVLFKSRWSVLKALVMPLIDKHYFAREILNEHERLLNEYNGRIRKEQKIKRAVIGIL